MEQYFTIFMDSIYPNIVNGFYSEKVFTFLTIEFFKIIQNNFLLLWMIAKILRVASSWTSNTLDDRIVGKYMSFLERFKPNPIKEEKSNIKEL